TVSVLISRSAAITIPSVHMKPTATVIGHVLSRPPRDMTRKTRLTALVGQVKRHPEHIPRHPAHASILSIFKLDHHPVTVITPRSRRLTTNPIWSASVYTGRLSATNQRV